MKASRTLLVLLAVGLVIGLAACGGGGGSDGSTTTARSASAPTASTATPKFQSAAETRAERKAAGRAAPFVVRESDNSVPTFGTEASASERREVETSLKSYLRSRAAEEWGRACVGLAVPIREGLEKFNRSPTKGENCTRSLAGLSAGTDLKDPLAGKLLSLRVHADNAYALFYGPGHQQYFVPLLREGGAWRPTQLAPLEYPPGASG
jgi:hypothetical protein